nr:hypothetical protein [uncultured Sphingomonas sp.]
MAAASAASQGKIDIRVSLPSMAAAGESEAAIVCSGGSAGATMEFAGGVDESAALLEITVGRAGVGSASSVERDSAWLSPFAAGDGDVLVDVGALRCGVGCAAGGGGAGRGAVTVVLFVGAGRVACPSREKLRN